MGATAVVGFHATPDVLIAGKGILMPKSYPSFLTLLLIHTANIKLKLNKNILLQTKTTYEKDFSVKQMQ